MAHHTVTFVDDEALSGHDWALLEIEGDVYFVVKRSAVTPDVLEEGWAAYRLLTAKAAVPKQRAGSSAELLQFAD